MHILLRPRALPGLQGCKLPPRQRVSNPTSQPRGPDGRRRWQLTPLEAWSCARRPKAWMSRVGSGVEPIAADREGPEARRDPVRIRLSGYEDWNGEAEVKEAGPSELNVALVRSRGRLVIGSEPAGLHFRIQGSDHAESGTAGPQPHDLPTGSYLLTVSRRGYADVTKYVEVKRNSTIIEKIAVGAVISGTWTWTLPGRGGGPGAEPTLTLSYREGRLTGSVSGSGRIGGADPALLISRSKTNTWPSAWCGTVRDPDRFPVFRETGRRCHSGHAGIARPGVSGARDWRQTSHGSPLFYRAAHHCFMVSIAWWIAGNRLHSASCTAARSGRPARP